MPILREDFIVHYYAENAQTGEPVTSDDGNHTFRLARDDSIISANLNSNGEFDATNAPGLYYGEVGGDANTSRSMTLYVNSSAPDVRIRPVSWSNESGAAGRFMEAGTQI